MKTIYIVRHGETIWNLEGRIQGYSDSPLTETGKEQARVTGLFLKSFGIEEIHTSDLGRAVHTATIINNSLNVNIIKNDTLREGNYGILEGEKFKDIPVKFPKVYSKMKDKDLFFVIPGGESISGYTQRVVSAILSIAKKTEKDKILIVIHGGLLGKILYHVLGIDFKEERKFSIDNCAINIFTWSGEKLFLKTWGFAEHLDSIKITKPIDI